MDDYKKRFFDILEWVRALYPSMKGMVKEDAEHLFPELKADYDKEIKSILKIAVSQMAWLDEDKNRCFAWIERQGYKMPPKWLYRLEYKDASCGLWYDGDGNWCFNQGIGSVDGCKTKSLPMEYDERYKQDGRNWFSSCSRKEDLMHWYSLDDAKTLLEKGFVFTRYLATEYHEYEQQTVFIKETALYREEIDIFELFGRNVSKNVWRPSDEQIKVLETVNITGCMTEPHEGEVLIGLYNDLKRLKNGC